jgi:predicted XRE-type DNA-binding protein
MRIAVTEVLEKKRLTQIQGAQLLDIDQPKVSKLLRGQLREFSTERLFHLLTALD